MAEVADAPKLRSAAKRQEIKVWTPEELHAFLGLAAENRNHTAWFLTSHTGMRRGEVLGLRWGDVDFDKRRLSVRQAVILVAYKLMIADVKTDAGRRPIDLDERTIAVLRGWRKRQLEERMLVGPAAYQDNDLVFARPDGTPTNPDAFSQSFDRLVARCELPRIRLHDLRHSHASILVKAGVPVKVVSERLGHANPASRSPSTNTSSPACRPTPPVSSRTWSPACSRPLYRSAAPATTCKSPVGVAGLFDPLVIDGRPHLVTARRLLTRFNRGRQVERLVQPLVDISRRVLITVLADIDYDRTLGSGNPSSNRHRPHR